MEPYLSAEMLSVYSTAPKNVLIYKPQNLQEGSYLPSNRNSPKSEQIENSPVAILISTEQF